jgi:FixH protein
MGSTRAPSQTWLKRPAPAVCLALAVTSLAAAGIHFAVMADHFNEYFVFGLFFSVVAWLQALWALGVVIAPTRQLLIGGLVANAVIVAVWVLSRTAGLPIGPDAGTPEPATVLDVLSTALEVGIVLGTAALLWRRGAPREDRGGRAASRLVVGLGLALVCLTTAAVALAGGHEDGEHADGYHSETPGDPAPTRIDLGAGRSLQVLLDEAGGTAQMHLTFFEAKGQGLAVESLSVTAVSHEGDEVSVPVQPFEPSHYAATLDLEPGHWEFEVEGVATDGDAFTADFEAEVP